MKRTYYCEVNILLEEMKYFEKHLSEIDSTDEIDIAVQCDIDIFEWLISYIRPGYITQNNAPRLELINVVPILISADFLQMNRLINDCISFISKNLNAMAGLNQDMSNISVACMKKLSKLVTLSDLEHYKDPKDRLQSRIYMNKVEDLLNTNSISFMKCKNCHELYVDEFSDLTNCTSSSVEIDALGR